MPHMRVLAHAGANLQYGGVFLTLRNVGVKKTHTRVQSEAVHVAAMCAT